LISIIDEAIKKANEIMGKW